MQGREHQEQREREGIKKQGKGHDVRLSKNLARLLRHAAVEQGLPIDAGGWVPVQALLSYFRRTGKEVNLRNLEDVVRLNEKKRFEMKEEKGKLFMRATQGHSMAQVQTRELLQPISDPSLFPEVIHGTFMKVWHLIQEQGLKRMARNHIHFAPGRNKEDGVISGVPNSFQIVIEIDLAKAIRQGIEFFISTNNVILTEGIDGVLPPRYFKRVTHRRGGIIWEQPQYEGNNN